MPLLENGVPTCPSGRFYRVRAGDTLISIAAKISIPWQELLELNPEIEPENLQAGQLLCLPGARPCPSGVFWEIAAGDTLYTIAQATGSTVEEIARLNPLLDPLNLQIGQTLCLPG